MVALQAIIPVAGNGLRLRPITNTKPKALIEVAGKPVLDHIISKMIDSDIDDLVLVVGHMKQSVIDWVEAKYHNKFKLHFVEQEKKLGLGHAIYCAKDYLDQSEVLITLGDEIFARSYSSMIQEFRAINDTNYVVGIKEVEDPTHYGMIRLNENDVITEMIEKPLQFNGRLALAGIYYFRHGLDLVGALDEVISRNPNKGEYQLTDALQLMVENGCRFSTIKVGECYDCGRIDKIISSNQRLLENKHFIHKSSNIINSEIIEPCYIDEDSKITNSRIGPYVSVGTKVSIENSKIERAIIESNTVAIGLKESYGIFSGIESLFKNSKADQS